MTDPVLGAAYVVEWLPEAWFWLLFGILAIYLGLDGFDFGIGLLYATRGSESDRELLHAAFGPIWKANEVWFVLFVTILFAAYPSVYANLLSRHYLLVFLLLLGLILRGVGVKLRKERDDERWKRYCDYAFVLGSLLSPLVLGAFVVRWGFVDVPASVALLGGVALVALCLVLGATFLAIKTQGVLRAEMVTYATRGTPIYFALFAGTGGILYGIGSIELTVVTVAAVTAGLCSLGIIAASYADHHYVAFGAAIGLVIAFVGFVATGLYPMIDPAADLAIRDAVVSPRTLNVTTVMALIFLPAVALGFVMLYSVFEGVADPEHGY
ncbi:cytochrome d ubiquinol oxidase subunit II [Natronococcus wangiae]|uniref:cytochrome d ubiquinol oxidase subunit II n=1 Tax=Natronococcus wangiae TaxID=3068275 RepID=UPI00273F6BDC|nr:cytochrome d ubiquinol oxidase subunit II [Natronococcus sp. AD5]